MKLYFRTARWTGALGFIVMLASTMSPVLAEPASGGPASVADTLNTAITAGDEEGVRKLLDPDVLIFESGGVESSLEEYASHHMHSDMEFMAGMAREVLDRNVFEAGDMAVVTTRSRLRGSFRDRELDLFSTETLVMTKTDQGWKVRHIHWSSTSAE